MKDAQIMFDGTEGELILSSSADSMKKRHQSKKKDISKSLTENYVEAEFFGLKKFEQLIGAFKEECVGFRVYYGSQFEDHSKAELTITEEGKGKKTSRLVIVPVDAYGNDLVTPSGLKDMAGTGTALANGPVCPNRCAPPTKPDEK